MSKWSSVLLLATLAAGCRSAAPISLDPYGTTTLHVGDTAVLHMPTESLYAESGINGAWQDVLRPLRSYGREYLFRAVRSGPGVIIISTDVPAGACISCATLHYVIRVLPME